MRTALRLDAREPYLDHHRPGALPLLGTAMGVALLSRIAVPLLDEADADAGRHLVISDVTIGPSLQVAGDDADVSVSAITSVGADSPIVHAGLSSVADGLTVDHYQAAFARARATRAPRSRPRTTAPRDTVAAAHIYELFFHGPAFRLVAEAGLTGGAMVSRAGAVPALTRHPAPVDPVDPVLVELAMQTAGLLDVATRRRMMIPASVARLEYDERPRAVDAELTAIATHIGSSDAFDVDVFADDRWCLSIIGYGTRPLPFPAPTVGIERLADEFARRAT